jgi:hypothetical protein
MKVLFTFFIFFYLLSTVVLSQNIVFKDIYLVNEIRSNNDEFAPRIVNNQLYWIEAANSKILKKSLSLPLGSSPTTVLSEGSFLDVYSSSSVIARQMQTEEYLTMQLFLSIDSEIESIPLFPEIAYCSQPSVSPSGSTLFFTGISDVSLQTTDIYYSQKVNGKWQFPIVLSSKINTNANEITPFAISDDSLIFASNGLGGKGGFDLFFVTKEEGQWTDPISLTDVNSSANDSDPFLLDNGTFFFASDRLGNIGGYDIYTATMVKEKEVAKETISLFPSTIEILSGVTEEIISIPTVIPTQWLFNQPSKSSSEFPLYDEWNSTIGLLSFQSEHSNSIISIHIPPSISTTPSLISKIRTLLKNSTPLIQNSSTISDDVITITTDNVLLFRPISISNSSQKLLTPQISILWNRKDFDAVKWEVSIATNSLKLRSVEGVCLPEENSLRLNLDSMLQQFSLEDQTAFCTVYLINSQSEVLEHTFSIPIIRTTISKSGKNNAVWNSFYSYYGEENAKKTVYSQYASIVVEALQKKDLVLEYVEGNILDAEIFKQVLEKYGKSITLKKRTSPFHQGTGAYALDATLMTISFPR